MLPVIFHSILVSLEVSDSLYMKILKNIRYQNSCLKKKKKINEHISLKRLYVLYLGFLARGCFPCLFTKFSFASSMSAFHSFSETMGGLSCLRSVKLQFIPILGPGIF